MSQMSDMDAYDRLPAEIREAISGATVRISVAAVASRIRDGVTIREILDEIKAAEVIAAGTEALRQARAARRKA